MTEEQAKEAVLAALRGEAPQTDEQALGAGMRGQGGTSSVSQRSQTAEEQFKELWAAGEQARKEAGGSMGLVEPSDPRSEFTEEETEQYLAGEKEITLPGTDTTHRFGSPKMPLAKRALTTLTDEDIYEIAEDPTFPESWQSSEDLSYSPMSSFTVRDQLRRIYGIDYANKYPNMSQIERAALLKTAKDLSLREKRFQQTAKPVLEKAGDVAAEGVKVRSAVEAPYRTAVKEYGIPYIVEAYGDLKTFFERVARLEQTEEELERLRRDMEILRAPQEDTAAPPVSEADNDTGSIRR
tara:strand:+ start:378 stop:1265 length:888 start_codon:yes stop_codon:yes gene_type:complete